jgi:hypothetical protein
MGWWDAMKSCVAGNTIKVLVRHTIAVIVAFLCFWLTVETLQFL